MIRAGVGISASSGSAEAAREAARQAVAGLRGEGADWCIVFATSHHASTIADALGTLATETGTPYLAGCTGWGVLAGEREIEGGPALGVLAVAADRLRGTPFLFPDEGDLGLTAGRRLGERLVTSRGTGDLVLVWPDPLHVRPDRLLQGLDATLHGIPVAGGAAASGGPHEATLQLCGSEAASGSVSGIRLGGTFRHHVAITQGCRPLTGPLKVTESHENLILEIDGRPAMQVLREVAPEGVLDRSESAFNYLFVGLVPDSPEPNVRTGDYLIRNILTADDDTGVLGISEEVEEGRRLVFALRGGAAAREDLERVLDGLVREADPSRFRFGLYFNCLARGRSLYREEGIDAALISHALPGLPLLGFFGNAEIAPLRGVNHLFTYTGVLVLVGD
ncbi:MAG: FIST C-terminal domain-containing protein [Acidobacteriia bacterium]|nr:FIST C-terminal domain-containing protein [Terriglobia bacterium]